MNLQLAKKYSRAIFDVAQEDGCLEKYGAELAAVSQTLLGHSGLQAYMANPQIQPQAKKDVIKKIFAEDLSPMVCNFLYLLVDKHREVLLIEIERAYQQLSNKARGVIVADVTVAKSIGKNQQDKLLAKLAELTGKEVKLRTHTDERIIGGVVIKIGDKRIDGSVTGRMAALQKQLLANN